MSILLSCQIFSSGELLPISKSAIKKYSKTKDRNIGEMFLRIPVHAFVQTALQPKPPSTEKLLGTVFVAFAKNMP